MEMNSRGRVIARDKYSSIYKDDLGSARYSKRSRCVPQPILPQSQWWLTKQYNTYSLPTLHKESHPKFTTKHGAGATLGATLEVAR